MKHGAGANPLTHVAQTSLRRTGAGLFLSPSSNEFERSYGIYPSPTGCSGRRRALGSAAAMLLAALSVPNLALAAAPAGAGRAPAEPITEEVITVVGTRTERSVREVAATVAVKTSEEIERELARDIADLVRFEPGVTVGGNGSRFGLGGFNIRGIDGNRVLTLVDGVRQPEEFSFGPFLSARRDFVDIDALERVEIARGPISSLWGSDALGGVVAFTTRGPQEYLGAERNVAAAFRAGYSTADEATNGTLDFAVGNERFGALLTATRRDGSETETAGGIGGTGPAREEADPQSIETTNLNLKLNFRPAEAHEFGLSLTDYETLSDSRVLSDYNTFSRGVTVLSRDAEDERHRQGVTLDYRYRAPEQLLSDLQLKIYRQESMTEQLTLENRAGGFGLQRRNRLSEFEQTIEGVIAQSSLSFGLGNTQHTLTFGVDHYETDSETLRSGGTVDSTGAPVREFLPLPTRDFPSTVVTQTAFFLQDEIELLDGRLLLSPGLRYDRFDADVNADAIYRLGNPGIAEPVDYDDSELTAKLGAVYNLTDRQSVYGRYSEGFRAPPYDDVNVGFTNFIGGYKTISNPDLVSETSQGLEAGWRFTGDQTSVSVAVFRNDYDDFIQALAIAPQFLASGGVDPADGLLTFQSVNRAEVRIEGAELSIDTGLGAFSERLAGFGARVSIAYADGEDRDRDEAVNEIEPLTAVLGLIYDAPSGRFGGNVTWTLVEAKDEGDIDSTNPRLATGGYGIVDLLAYYRFNETVSLNVGLFNIGDKRYLRWADTAGIGTDAPGRFTQPGFNAAATLKVSL